MKYLEFENYLRASYSFAVEEYIMRSPKFTDEYFMFWRTNPCLMIGRFQNTVEEINQEFARENNIEITRRNSGGGTVYTDTECWQFSFITNRKDGKTKDFRDFTKPVTDALNELGADATFNNRNDLTISNKKFSGNAQYGIKERFLHHGTLLFNTNIDNLVLSLRIADEKIRSKGIKSVRERVTNLKPYLKKPETDSLEFRNAMINFIKGDMETVTLDDEDRKAISAIEEKKFTTWGWNYGESPKFNYSNAQRFEGGKIDVHLYVSEGIIKQCSLYGDFFCKGDISIITNSVIGIKYQRDDIFAALEEVNTSDMLYNISIEELLSCFID
ncbi:MAG: lipoate--protein ligase [Marinilabiliales bacterium]|nr:MAG: lipoate--protein ligase [Marinilabiliales bacterium]